MREELYRNYISDPDYYKPAERDVGSEPISVLEIDTNRQKEIYLLDLEI